MPAEIVSLYPIDCPVRLLAPAKVNLFIDVLGRRPDGFHDIDAVNASVDLFDEIEVELNDKGIHEVESNWPHIPTDESNHVVKAAREILKGTRWGIKARIEKRIPVGAGLGGGTSDAAALIRYLARVFCLGEKGLVNRALTVGSDVPYCLVGGPARVRGRGERITPIPDAVPLRLVILDPGGNHNTGAIYGRLAPASARIHPPMEPFIQAWQAGDLKEMAGRMFNAFQQTVFDLEPRLGRLRDSLVEAGCLAATLTGTGSHLIGLLAQEAPGPETWNWNLTERPPVEVKTIPAQFPGWIRRVHPATND